jgi:hypothetical protein
LRRLVYRVEKKKPMTRKRVDMPRTPTARPTLAEAESEASDEEMEGGKSDVEGGETLVGTGPAMEYRVMEVEGVMMGVGRVLMVERERKPDGIREGDDVMIGRVGLASVR